MDRIDKPPSDKQAEYAIISALACEPNLMQYVSRFTPEYFFDNECRRAFTEILACHTGGRLWLVTDYASFIAAAEPDLFLPHFLERVARVRDAYASRYALEKLKDGARAAYAMDVDRLISIFTDTRIPISVYDGLTISQVASDLWDDIGKGETGVVHTGFSALDKARILRRQELTVLAARPSMGKSQLAFQIAYNVAKAGGHVIIASLEMSSRQVAIRIAQSISGRSFREIDDESQSAISLAMADLMSMDNLIVLDDAMTSNDLLALARLQQGAAGKIDLIVSDHLRLFRDRHNAERHRLGQISSNHRDMAHEFDCPVILCAQLNRSVEHRGKDERRPGLVDLRDSGEIEENADVAAFIYREDYYDNEKRAGDQSGITEVYAAKNRNGPLWASRLYFDAKRGPRFANVQY